MLTQQAEAVLYDLSRRAAKWPEPDDPDERLERARAMTAGQSRYSGDSVSMHAVDTVSVPGPDDVSIDVRLYRPTSGTLPLLVWYHGGGGMAGSLDSHDSALRSLARRTGRAVASVDYRLAPEHPFPTPVDDCLAATRALRDGAGGEAVDATRWAIGGDSIGGLFAALIALRFRGAQEPLPEAMVLAYPNTDLRPDRDWPSLHEESGRVMTVDSLAYENDLFVPDVAARYRPDVSPLVATDLSGLPRAFVATCEHDPLRDEGEAFARRMEDAGVAVTAQRYDGVIHALLQHGDWIPQSYDLMDAIGAFLAAEPA